MEEQIFKYLNNLLTEKERLEFEQKVQSDPSLSQELELEQIIHGAVVDDSLLDWKESINDSMSQLKRKKQIKKTTIISLSLLIATGLAVWVSSQINDQVKEPKISFITTEKNNSLLEENHNNYINEEVKSNPHVDRKSNASTNSKKTESQEISNELISLDSSNENEVVENQILIEDVLLNTDTLEDLVVTKVSEGEANPCDNLDFALTITTEKTCEDYDNGQVIIDQGDKNLEFKIVSDDFESDWSNEELYNDLEAGDYEILMRNDRDCLSKKTKKFTIESKMCYEPEKGFYPEKENWIYENQWEDEVYFYIYDKSGVIVVEDLLETEFVWDGRDLNGNLVPLGQYKYQVKQNGLYLSSGSVTVLR